ncbi:trans-sulfuration enzyme family protein [Winogradskyella sp.]|uniref:trans-sulfuration enzyme family protein n=1 Tax=Winogradskyella sp. TaxID=1883156 RepID=UPI003BAD0E47
MRDKAIKDRNFETVSVHSGTDIKDHFGALSVPIYNASTYAFENAEKGSAIHEGEIKGYFYSRINNPTQEALELALAALEQGESAITFSSGMAAISNCLLTLLKRDDHIIAPQSIYASTSSLFGFLEAKFGIKTTFVDATESSQYQKHITNRTKVLYLESPANPTLKLTDIKAAVKIAKAFKLKTVMDNTFATPFNQHPIAMGVDAVIHSLTKYIGGHADILAGALISSKELVEQCRWNTNKYLGGVIAPHTAWLAHRGIKTFALRMEKHNSNALKVAQFLENHSKVSKVHYPGLPSHPQYHLAKEQMKGYGGMIAFEVNGIESGRTLVNNLDLITLAVSLGDVSSIIQHSASMTHASVPENLRKKAGINDGLLRLSVGIERVEDIINDLRQALKLI